MPNVIMTKGELDSLNFKLQNRFKILAFLDEKGVRWAEVAINPENETCWSHDEYLACYNNPEA